MNALANLPCELGVVSSAVLGVGFVAFIIGLLVALILQPRRHQDDGVHCEIPILSLQSLDESQQQRQAAHQRMLGCSGRNTPTQADNMPHMNLRNQMKELRDSGMTAEQAELYLAAEVAAVLRENQIASGRLTNYEPTPHSLLKARQSFRACESSESSFDVVCQSNRKASQISAQQLRRRWQILRRLGQALKAKFRVAATYAPTPNDQKLSHGHGNHP